MSRLKALKALFSLFLLTAAAAASQPLNSFIDNEVTHSGDLVLYSLMWCFHDEVTTVPVDTSVCACGFISQSEANANMLGVW